MAITREEVEGELRKLDKTDLEIKGLLDPEAKPTKDFPHISIGFHPLDEWLNLQPVPRQKPLRLALHRFALAQIDYRNEVLKQLGALGGRRTGKALLAEISGVSSKTVAIVPTFTDDPFDADTHADDAVAATRLGFKERDQDGLSFPGPILGTGQGSDSTVHYTPVPKGTASSGPGSLSDEILLHELVHAGRQVKGIQNFEAIHNGAQNEEEYLAIIVTNVYLSEKKQTKFRGPNHKAFDVLPQPERFLEGQRERQLMEKLRSGQNSLWGALINIDASEAAFDPPRAWEAQRAKVFIDI
jgi:hypothetical protein